MPGAVVPGEVEKKGMVRNPLHVAQPAQVVEVAPSIKACLNAYMSTHLDAPFSKKEILAAAVLGAALAYGGIQGIGPSTYLFINWAFPDSFYYALTKQQQDTTDVFSRRVCNALQPFLGLYGLARGYDIVNRARYARSGQFADLFVPVKKGVAAVGYGGAGIFAAALAANQVSLYYKVGGIADLADKGSFHPEEFADQFAILGVYVFCESLDPMVTGVSGFTRPNSTLTRKELLEGFAKAAQGINKLDKPATIKSYSEFKSLEPVAQLRILMKYGEGEELPLPSLWHLLLMKYKKGEKLPVGWQWQAYKEVVPVVVGGWVAYTQWQFARQLPTRFDILSGTTLDEGIGYTAAMVTTALKGGLAYMQTKAMGRYVHDVFTCNRANQVPRSTRRSPFYEITNTVIPAAYSSLLALSVGLNIYFQLYPTALPDQEYDSAHRVVVTAVSAYAFAEIADHTVRLAQGNLYLPELVTNTTKKVTSTATRVKKAVAAKLPNCVKEAYGTAKETCTAAKAAVASCVPGWLSSSYGWLSSGVSNGCGYVKGKITHVLTGRAPGEDISAIQMRNEMISRLEQGQYIARAGTDETVKVLKESIAAGAAAVSTVAVAVAVATAASEA